MTFELGTIISTTDGQVRRVEYLRLRHPIEYQAVVDELGVDVGLPITAAKEDDSTYRFVYARKDRPSVFSEDHEIYSLRIDKTTGSVSGKAYDAGNILNKKVAFSVVATGVYTDSDMYTLYHSIDGSVIQALDIIKVSVPFKGTTYNPDGSVFSTTEYSVQE